MFKSLNNSLYEIFSNLFNDKDKNSIIEPLICLVRLAILDFKPPKTKISIFNNRITYNEPNILQGAVRWSNGDTRDDLHNIYLPITKATYWYDISNPDIKNIFKYSIRGLEKLKTSYSRNSTINHSIQFYINYLREYITKESTRNKVEDKTNEDETNTIFNKLKGIWNDREISIINNLILELENRRNSDEDHETIINTIETLLVSKENKVYDLILKTTTLLE